MKDISIRCDHCGKEFLRKEYAIKPHNFCSTACYGAWRKDSSKKKNRMWQENFSDSRFKRIYFAYPYSDDPVERTEEIKQRIRELVEIRKDVVPLIPHLMFDELFDHPGGYMLMFIGPWEFEVIADADYICLPPLITPCERQCGTVWERVFAGWIGTPEVEWDYLLAGGEI